MGEDFSTTPLSYESYSPTRRAGWGLSPRITTVELDKICYQQNQEVTLCKDCNDMLASHPSFHSLAPDDARFVNEACDRFESAWQYATAPAIECFLEQSAPTNRVTLARELVIIDIAVRKRLGQPFAGSDYIERFPELEKSWLSRAINNETSPIRSPFSKPRFDQV